MVDILGKLCFGHTISDKTCYLVWTLKKKHFYDVCAHFCAPFGQNMCTFVRFLKIFDVRIFVRVLAKICAHLSLELLNTLGLDFSTFFRISVAESHPSYSNGWKFETQRRSPELNRGSS